MFTAPTTPTTAQVLEFGFPFDVCGDISQRCREIVEEGGDYFDLSLYLLLEVDRVFLEYSPEWREVREKINQFTG